MATGELESIEAAVALAIDNGSDIMEFNLWTDNDDLPDVLLWTGFVQPDMNASIVTIEANELLLPTLTEGTVYWLSARSVNAINGYVWFLNDQGIESERAVDAQGGTDWDLTLQLTDQPAFRVNVSSTIPEPIDNRGHLAWTSRSLSSSNSLASPFRGPFDSLLMVVAFPANSQQ